MTPTPYASALQTLQRQTAVVIPACFPLDAGPAFARCLLLDTARAFCREVTDAAGVCLSVDGPGPAQQAAQAAREELGVQVVQAPENGGKLSALRLGMRRMLDGERYRYLVAADQDGDHFANELVTFVRAAQHVEHTEGTDRVMVLGRRISRHRPLGLLRGELEELADRILLDALHYDAALTGRPLRLQYASTLDEFPDFHSGYKLFTARTARDVFLPEPRAAGGGDQGCQRHAVEAVLTVEAIKAGAWLAAVNRSTLDEQPVSTFGLIERGRLFADKILWPCRRLDVPAPFVEQWMRNHLVRLRLGTLVPQGRDELLAVYRTVMAALGVPRDQVDAADPLTRPRFI